MAKNTRDECISCGEEASDQCPHSKRKCGHHCNHSWNQDECCWCGETFGEEQAEQKTKETDHGR